MPIRIFSINAQGDEASALELNRFLSGKRVLGIERALVQSGSLAYWTFCVEYLDGEAKTAARNSRMAKKVDYREILEESAFARFAAMRQKRKELAETEGVPAYAIFTNEQLAAIAKMVNPTLAALKTVEGIGEAKVAKYGEAMMKVCLKEINTRKEPASDEANRKDLE